jgi:hypothetical protein
LFQPLVQRAQQWMRRRGQTADAHLADRRAGGRAHVIDQLIAAGEPRPDLRRDPLPELGQHDPATGALEQAPAARLLELADPAADMRLACAIGERDLAQAAELGSVDEKLPRSVVHAFSGYTVLIISELPDLCLPI